MSAHRRGRPAAYPRKGELTIPAVKAVNHRQPSPSTGSVVRPKLTSADGSGQSRHPPPTNSTSKLGKFPCFEHAENRQPPLPFGRLPSARGTAETRCSTANPRAFPSLPRLSVPRFRGVLFLSPCLHFGQALATAARGCTAGSINDHADELHSPAEQSPCNCCNAQRQLGPSRGIGQGPGPQAR